MNATAAESRLRATMTGADVDLLISYLEEEAQVQSRLLKKLVEKEALLVKQDLDGLKQCLGQSAPIVERLEACTQRRIRILRSFGGRLGLSPEHIQISGLLDRCADEDRSGLEEARNRLRDVLVRVGNQNRRNHILIRNGIELNEALVLALFGGGETHKTYDRTARSLNSPPSRPLLNREL